MDQAGGRGSQASHSDHSDAEDPGAVIDRSDGEGSDRRDGGEVIAGMGRD